MKFDTLIGRQNKRSILEWFNNGKPKKKVAIIQGTSGNGKTSLIRALAHDTGCELHEVFLDEDKNNILKAINTSISGYKIVLIDDFDTYNARHRDTLYYILSIIIYPVVITCTEWKFKPIVFGKSQYIRFVRPRTSEIEDLLSNKNLPDQLVEEIAKNANSVAEALNCTISREIPERKDVALSNNDKLSLLSQRRLNERIEKPNINFYYWSIRGYNDDTFKVLNEFAYYDYICHQRFARIDPWIVNNMEAPIENITIKQRRPHKKKKELKPLPKKPKKTPQKKVDGLDAFLE